MHAKSGVKINQGMPRENENLFIGWFHLPIDASILRKMPVTTCRLLTEFPEWYNTCEVELDWMAGWKGQRPSLRHSESTSIPMRSFLMTWKPKFSVSTIVPFVSLLSCT